MEQLLTRLWSWILFLMINLYNIERYMWNLIILVILSWRSRVRIYPVASLFAGGMQIAIISRYSAVLNPIA